MSFEPTPQPASQQPRLILARFTRDMVETLLKYFQFYQRDDVVTLQITAGGRLWLVNPHDGTRQFLGQAVLSDVERERLRRARGGLN